MEGIGEGERPGWGGGRDDGWKVGRVESGFEPEQGRRWKTSASGSEWTLIIGESVPDQNDIMMEEVALDQVFEANMRGQMLGTGKRAERMDTKSSWKGQLENRWGIW